MSMRSGGSGCRSFSRRATSAVLLGLWCAAGAAAANELVQPTNNGNVGVAPIIVRPVGCGLIAIPVEHQLEFLNEQQFQIAAANAAGGQDQNSNGVPNNQEVIRCVTPVAWQGARVDWNRDVNPPNKIEDAVDQAAEDQMFDIVVNYKRGIAQADMGFLSNLGGPARVTQLGKYITFAAMRDVTKAQISLIAARPEVAFVEVQHGFGPSLNVSVPNICVTPATGGCPQTVQGIFPGLDGTGINIAIIDSGVDEGHCGFRPGQFVAGYNAITRVFQNPDDDIGHGTHVAAIAMGRTSGGHSRGVAPGAGLIDVRVFGAGIFCNTPGQWENIVNGLETVYDNRAAWNVRVINMSLRQCDAFGTVPSNGLDAFSQLVDLAESMGIVTVAAAGNDGPSNNFISTPAAATRAITVAASNDLNTVTRADDQIAIFSSRGPRTNDGDPDQIDELKPEVAAPGNSIVAAAHNTTCGTVAFSGTSMAAPHVAGLAALLMQAKPGINAASVKTMIVSGAEPRGGCSLCSIDPVWNNRWGWGLVNAFNSVNTATQTDMSFPNYPSNPIWMSPDIRTETPPRVGIPNRIFGMIQNRGPNTASNVRVHFGVHVFSASVPTFFDIGTFVLPSINSGQSIEVSVAWVPQAASHQCAKVEIAYGPDTNFSNNIAQRNLFVAQSPVEFQVRQLFAGGAQEIKFTASINAPRPGWQVQFTPPAITLASDDCPVNVVALPLPPFGTPNGERATIHVEAKTGACSLGGVTISAIMKDCNGNGWDDYEDIRDGRAQDRNGNGVPDTCDPVTCQLDLDGNGRITIDDAFNIFESWDEIGVGDVNGNGVTDDKDLESILRALGEVCQIPGGTQHR